MVKPTTTYSRRHRLKNSEDPQANVEIAGNSVQNIENNSPHDEDAPLNHPARFSSTGGRKRSGDPGLDSTRPEPNLRKKKKLTKEATSPRMSIQPFQTPFPTLQTQSQVFRLPSSKPQASPEERGSGLLSPAAIQAANVPKSKILKENQVRKSGNSSRYTETLKSSRGHGDSSKTLSSMTLTSSAFPASKDNRLSHRLQDRGSRSGSRSTSCSSSNSNASRNIKKKSGLKHTQSLSSLKTGQNQAKKKQKSNKSKDTKRPSSRKLSSGPMTDEDFLTLASPFISRASSPVVDDASVVKQQPTQLMGPPPVPDARKRTSSGHGLRIALADTFYNPNLPKNAGKSQSVDTSPQKRSPTKVDLLRMKSKSSSRIENRVPEQGSAFSDRERRPSAPSWLHPPRPKKRFLERQFMKNVKDAPGNDPWDKQKLRLSSGLNIVLNSKAGAPQEAISKEVLRNAQKQKAMQDPDDAMEWMHSRRDINFDRPPSQMSIGGSGFGYEGGFEYGEIDGGDVFLSSEEGEDEDEDERQEALEGQRKPLGQRIQEVATNSARHRRMSPLDLDTVYTDQEFGALFGKDALIESTPQRLLFDQQNSNIKKTKPSGYATDTIVVDRNFHTTLTRTHSLPNVNPATTLSLLSSSSSSSAGAGSDPTRTRDELARDKDKEGRKPVSIENENEDQDGEADMELTADAISTAIKVSNLPLRNAAPNGHVGKEVSLDQVDADLTPWVTDSIISPPTLYLERKKKNGNAQTTLDGKANGGDGSVQGRGDEGERRGSRAAQLMRLSSPFRPSDGSTDTADNTSFNVLPNTEGPDEHEQIVDHYTEDTADSSDRAVRPHIVQYNDNTPSANTKRTRSGTIVPASAPAPAPPGTRRTRGGTIIGPLPPAPAPAKPLPAVPSMSGSATGEVGGRSEAGSGPPTRTRSGTIVSSSAAPAAGVTTLYGGRRTRSGSVLQASNAMVDKNVANDKTAIAEHYLDNMDLQNLEDEEQDEGGIPDVDCYVDSLYLPPLVSSPDPIDFLRFANIVEEDEECGPDNMLWLVAEDPPSPEVPKDKMVGGGGLFRSGRFGSLRRKLGGRSGGNVKGKGKKKTRFVGREGVEEQAEGSDRDRLGDEELSDDELLLIPGSTQSLWT